MMMPDEEPEWIQEEQDSSWLYDYKRRSEAAAAAAAVAVESHVLRLRSGARMTTIVAPK
jgi:hypothetical protein